MGTSFVSIGERGFWMHDSVLELWLRLLALHLEDPADGSSPSAATQIRDQWLLASRGFFSGCVPDGLDEAVSTTSGRELVEKAIKSLLEALSTCHATLDRNALNVLGIQGQFTRDVEVAKLVEVGQAFLDLIEGRVTTDASDTTFMPGSQ